MQVDLNTFITIGGFILSIVAVYTKSANTIAVVENTIKNIEKENDAKFSAMQAMMNLTQAQIADTRENIAGNYMKKPEISDIEKRMNDKHKEVVDVVRDINGKVDRLLQRGDPSK